MKTLLNNSIYPVLIVLAVAAAVYFYIDAAGWQSKYNKRLKDEQDQLSNNLDHSQKEVVRIVDTMYITTTEFIYITQQNNDTLKQKITAVRDTTYSNAAVDAFITKYRRRADSSRRN